MQYVQDKVVGVLCQAKRLEEVKTRLVTLFIERIKSSRNRAIYVIP